MWFRITATWFTGLTTAGAAIVLTGWSTVWVIWWWVVGSWVIQMFFRVCWSYAFIYRFRVWCLASNIFIMIFTVEAVSFAYSFRGYIVIYRINVWCLASYIFIMIPTIKTVRFTSAYSCRAMWSYTFIQWLRVWSLTARGFLVTFSRSMFRTYCFIYWFIVWVWVIRCSTTAFFWMTLITLSL